MNAHHTTLNPETGTQYSRAELLRAFNYVASPENWKLPIDASIPAERADVTREAVIFFAGCRPEFSMHTDPDRLHVQAVGYYMAVGA